MHSETNETDTALTTRRTTLIQLDVQQEQPGNASRFPPEKALRKRGLFLILLTTTAKGKEYVEEVLMSCLRAIVAILLPPLAVIDKGCGNLVVVTALTLVGWIPGVIAALIIVNMHSRRGDW